MNKVILRNLLITIFVSMVIGALALTPIINSSNGYVAGYFVMPWMILMAEHL